MVMPSWSDAWVHIYRNVAQEQSTGACHVKSAVKGHASAVIVAIDCSADFGETVISNNSQQLCAVEMLLHAWSCLA